MPPNEGACPLRAECLQCVGRMALTSPRKPFSIWCLASCLGFIRRSNCSHDCLLTGGDVDEAQGFVHAAHEILHADWAIGHGGTGFVRLAGGGIHLLGDDTSAVV